MATPQKNAPSFWNPANTLTLSRVFAAAILVALLKRSSPSSAIWAMVIFLAACFTDALDGWVARRRNQVTPWGQLMDPLADKILVFSVLACFVGTGEVPVWMFVVMLGREFLITSTRMLFAMHGSVRPARASGKNKTAAQMVLLWMLFMHHFWRCNPAFAPASQVNFRLFLDGALWIVTFLTLYSGYRFLREQAPWIKILPPSDRTPRR